jgi:hypothetical protein
MEIIRVDFITGNGVVSWIKKKPGEKFTPGVMV